LFLVLRFTKKLDTPKEGKGKINMDLFKFKTNKKALAWAFYDWGNSAFATTVMAGFFPIFFKNFMCIGKEVTTSTLQLGIANSIACIIVAIMAPILGAIADSGGTRKKFLFIFTLLGVIATGLFAVLSNGDWQMAMLVYILASLGFSGAVVFYDSLLPSVCSTAESDYVSALGYALGYLGGGLLFVINVAMVLKPDLFGLSSVKEAIQISFITVSVWWIVFTIPLMIVVQEMKKQSPPFGQAVKEGFGELKRTFLEIKKFKVIVIFLIAYWLYIDGVGTIIKMAIDYGLALGFDQKNLITALLITQFVGFPAALVFGKIGTKIGPKIGIYIGLVIYIAVSIMGFFMQHVWQFYLLAATVGLVQGGVQSLSRSLYLRLIPVAKSAEFYGFYNMLGKFAAVMGPLLVGFTSYLTGSPRISILSLILLFGLGGYILTFVDLEKGEQMATETG